MQCLRNSETVVYMGVPISPNFHLIQAMYLDQADKIYPFSWKQQEPNTTVQLWNSISSSKFMSCLSDVTKHKLQSQIGSFQIFNNNSHLQHLRMSLYYNSNMFIIRLILQDRINKESTESGNLATLILSNSARLAHYFCRGRERGEKNEFSRKWNDSFH